MSTQEAHTVDEWPPIHAEKASEAMYADPNVYDYCITEKLALVEIETEVDVMPDSVAAAMNGAGWTHAHEETIDGEYDPWENTTIFAFRPGPGV